MEASPTELSELAHTFVRLAQAGVSAEEIDRNTEGQFSGCQDVWRTMTLPHVHSDDVAHVFTGFDRGCPIYQDFYIGPQIKEGDVANAPANGRPRLGKTMTMQVDQKNFNQRLVAALGLTGQRVTSITIKSSSKAGSPPEVTITRDIRPEEVDALIEAVESISKEGDR
jgi:hypothetical protein